MERRTQNSRVENAAHAGGIWHLEQSRGQARPMGISQSSSSTKSEWAPTLPRAGAARARAMSFRDGAASEPFTERVSPHAHLLESDGARGVLRALAACDRELLDETHASHPGLTHPSTLVAVSDLAEAVADCVRVGLDPPPASASTDPPAPARVFLVGAGTSGRVCFLAARAANETLARLGHPDPNLFHHVVAGAPAALFRASESVEDSRDAAAHDLRRVVRSSLPGATPSALSRVVVVGVSCGLSAAYVAEALERALDDHEGLFRGARVDVACIGFNPASFARPEFRDAIAALADGDGVPPRRENRGGRTLVNPVLGPEAIAGSTRMKGGTATKLVLDAAFAAAAVSACASRPIPGAVAMNETDAADAVVRDLIDDLVRRAFAAGGAATEAASASIAETDAEGLRVIIQSVAECLARGGRAHYVAADRDGSNVEDAVPEALRGSRAPSHVACLGAVDAAEQRPTFGTRPETYRGWGGDGWAAFGVAESDFSYDAFVSRRRDPNVQEVVVALFECPRKGTNAKTNGTETETETETMFAGTPCVGRVCARADPGAYDPPAWASSRRPGDVFIDVPAAAEETETAVEDTDEEGSADRARGRSAARATFREVFAPRVAELAMKHALNAVSTGAHVLLGKTLDGRMIDLRVGNEKLFRRAVDIVRRLAGDCSPGIATHALVRAMHGEAYPGGVAAGAMTARQHVEAAARRGAERVVPVAARIATGMSFEDALRADEENPRGLGRREREDGDGGGEEGDAKGVKRVRAR